MEEEDNAMTRSIEYKIVKEIEPHLKAINKLVSKYNGGEGNLDSKGSFYGQLKLGQLVAENLHGSLDNLSSCCFRLYLNGQKTKEVLSLVTGMIKADANLGADGKLEELGRELYGSAIAATETSGGVDIEKEEEEEDEC